MENISATIISLNEEARIRACLESLRDVADEIVVVDSGSTDRTVAVCLEMGCKVSTRPFDGYGAQRQYATSLTTHRFVLALDADEVLSPALRASLLQLKADGMTHRVYQMSRLNFYCGYPVKHCGWYPDRQIRLFDKRYASWNLDDVGERVVFRDSVKPQRLDGDILHYRCEMPEQYSRLMERHAAIKARQLVSAGEQVGLLTPIVKGMKALWEMYVSRGGMMEGSVGRRLAREECRAEYMAYSGARRLKRRK